MKTPVVLIIFKRPDTTARVFEAIREAQPSQLFVIADGYRPERPGELEKCEATRAIVNQVDWDCNVIKNYSDINLGCATRVSSGLDWVFEQVEEAIILEDDCLPNATFFPFCDELLEQYRFDHRVNSISGNNFQFGRRRTNYSYYFSVYNHSWGWATWRRAWQKYDLYIKLWKEIQQTNYLENILIDSEAVGYWSRIFESVYENPLGITWDYQWIFTNWMQNSLSIIPNVNLVSNIGFGSDATHCTSNGTSVYENMQVSEIDFPLRHPPYIIRDLKADKFTQATMFKETQIQKIKYYVKKAIAAKHRV
jgi:hypothetical protein